MQHHMQYVLEGQSPHALVSKQRQWLCPALLCTSTRMSVPLDVRVHVRVRVHVARARARAP